jgi:hypothetical protein
MTDRNRAPVVSDRFLIADLFSMRLESIGDEVCGTAQRCRGQVALTRTPALIRIGLVRIGVEVAGRWHGRSHYVMAGFIPIGVKVARCVVRPLPVRHGRVYPGHDIM